MDESPNHRFAVSDSAVELAIAFRRLLTATEAWEVEVDVRHARLLLRRLEQRNGMGHRRTCHHKSGL